jgi:hypothetical protein
MNQGVKVFICPVKDIARAKTLYSKLLGIEPILTRLIMLALKSETKN